MLQISPRRLCIMGNKRSKSDFRLYGKELYIVYPKMGIEEGIMFAKGFTNKKQADGIAGLNYDNLVRVFTRKRVNGRRVNYHEFKDAIVIRLFVSNITKGAQSFSRRGRGGIKQFKEQLRGGIDY